MSDLDAVLCLDELRAYNMQHKLRTPKNNSMSPIWDCALDHAVRALTEKINAKLNTSENPAPDEEPRPEFQMLPIDSVYSVRLMVANAVYDPDFTSAYPDDIYPDEASALRAHPGCEILHGVCLVDAKTEIIPFGCSRWHDNLKDVYEDYVRLTPPRV